MQYYDTVFVNRGNGKGKVKRTSKNGHLISQNEGESIEDFLKRIPLFQKIKKRFPLHEQHHS